MWESCSYSEDNSQSEDRQDAGGHPYINKLVVKMKTSRDHFPVQQFGDSGQAEDLKFN